MVPMTETRPAPPASTPVPPETSPAAGSAEFRRFWAMLPPDIRMSLTDSQRHAIATALNPRPAPHWIDLRSSIPIPGIPIYVTLLIGREKRSKARLASEGQLGALPTLVVIAIFGAIMVCGVAATIVLVDSLSVLSQTHAGSRMPLPWPPMTR